MRFNIVALAVAVGLAGVAHGQTLNTVGAGPVPSIYDPAKGPLPLDRRYVMTREGRDAAQWEAQNPAAQPVVQAQAAPAKNYYDMPKAPARTAVQAPAWFVNLPADTVDMVFSAGTATSTDEQMAYDKARMQAERKMVEIMGSQIRTLTKSYRNDQGENLIERFEQTIQKTADGNLVGVQRVDSQATFDGRMYKVYVLLRYPLGENNLLRKERETARLQKESALRSDRAHQELDQRTQQNRNDEAQEQQKQREELGPRPEPQAQSKVAPVTVPTAQGDLQLLNVDNEEYKRRRDETLQKSGAVVGQTVVR